MGTIKTNWDVAGPELLAAIKGLMKMIEDGKLVRDIHRDKDFMSFFDQSKELITVLTNANLAVRRAEGLDP